MAGELLKVQGQIREINLASRTMEVHEKDGNIRMVRWSQGHDQKMQKQKNGFFVTAIGENQEGMILLDSVEYWQRPDDWPGNKGNSKGGWNGPKTDPKKIAFLALSKNAVETIKMTDTQARDPAEVTKEAIALTLEWLKAYEAV